MTAAQLGVLAGALVGFGAFLALWAVLPAPRTDLAVALDRLITPQPLPEPAAASGGRYRRWVGHLASYSAGSTGLVLGAPVRDLLLLGRSVEAFVVRRLALAGLGLTLPALAWTAFTVAGLAVPVAIPAGLGVAAAVGLSLVPALSVREDARRAREEFGRATSAYLDLVAQERASGASPAQALIEAAQVGHGWVFGRIAHALQQATRVGITGWQALSDLGREVGVPELADLADILASAADGAAVYATLTKKAAALRAAALAADQAAANAASEKLSLPVSLLGVGFVLLLFYPAFVQLVTAAG